MGYRAQCRGRGPGRRRRGRSSRDASRRAREDALVRVFQEHDDFGDIAIVLAPVAAALAPERGVEFHHQEVFEGGRPDAVYDDGARENLRDRHADVVLLVLDVKIELDAVGTELVLAEPLVVLDGVERLEFLEVVAGKHGVAVVRALALGVLEARAVEPHGEAADCREAVREVLREFREVGLDGAEPVAGVVGHLPSIPGRDKAARGVLPSCDAYLLGRANATIWSASRWLVQKCAPSYASARAGNGMTARSSHTTSTAPASPRASTQVSQYGPCSSSSVVTR